MSPGVPVAWLPSFLLLLLLWFPGCVPLSGPEMVTGIVGGSLSVQCQYEEEYKTYDKYWCREWLLPLSCSKTVRTSGSEEVRKGRVSIRDHPVNLTFTVTLENLTLDDADTYLCRIKTPFLEGFDKSFKVKVSVVPGPTPGPAPGPTPGPAPGPSTDVTAKPLATRSTFPVPLPTALGTESPTQGSSSTEGYSEDQGLSLPALLSVLGLLLLLLVVTSMLAWRMFQKRVKAVEHPELSQNLRQGTENTEPQYVNLQLHTLPLREKPVPPSQVEVEYGTVVFPQEEVHYSSVVFDSKNQDSNANGVLARTPQGQETEYSVVVQKPRKAGSEPQL